MNRVSAYSDRAAGPEMVHEPERRGIGYVSAAGNTVFVYSSRNLRQ